MPINKVIYGSTTLIDLTSDTVTAADLSSGVTATDKSGTRITGTLSFITYYTGTAEPSSSLGSDGDIYLKVAS